MSSPLQLRLLQQLDAKQRNVRRVRTTPPSRHPADPRGLAQQRRRCLLGRHRAHRLPLAHRLPGPRRRRPQGQAQRRAGPLPHACPRAASPRLAAAKAQRLRLRLRAVDLPPLGPADRPTVRRPLQRQLPLRLAGRARLYPPEAHRPGPGARPGGHRPLARRGLAGAEKKRKRSRHTSC